MKAQAFRPLESEFATTDCLLCCVPLTDVNECETLQGVCGAALCENVEGSFLCVCPTSPEEFDPMTGRCVPPRTSAGETDVSVYLTVG